MSVNKLGSFCFTDLEIKGIVVNDPTSLNLKVFTVMKTQLFFGGGTKLAAFEGYH